MDRTLSEMLKRWEEKHDELCEARSIFLQLEAREKSLYSKLFQAADGKTIPEKEAEAYADPDWKKFKAGLAAAKTDYLKAKGINDIYSKALECEYLSYKVEAEAVRKPR